MPTSVTLSGVTFADADFTNYGWKATITVNSLSYIRLLGLFAAAMSDLGRSMVGSATSTHNLSTMTVGSSVSVTLSANVPYRSGAHIIISDPTTAANYFQLLLTVDCTVVTATGTVEVVSGSGSPSLWGVQPTGKIGPSGTGALARGGIKTANFNIATNTSYIVDLVTAAANVTATLLAATYSAEDEIEVIVLGDGTHTLTIDGITNSIKIQNVAQNGTITGSGRWRAKFENAGIGFLGGWSPYNSN